ncbi:hypothetical protein [Leptospira sp. GIMC2001]|uniref:hypothetical protein n=1 Tax=Leptospira sp. GIMC2001 TaxID=1513297 RepID=UPI00234BADF9|nr:hypothetical protein [Leptospira sp. GIMC2001]WCL51515.1 hypothetical protein O4O04_20070 [Leptospira sp. GIMC2001]
MRQFSLKNIFGLILSVLVVSVFLFYGDLMATGGGLVTVALVAPTFTNFKELKEFAKSFNANSEGITDLTALTNGEALTMHSLDETMVLMAQDTHDYKFMNTMFMKDTKSTLNIFGRIVDWGDNGDPSFVGETDDAEFKDVVIDRIARSVSFLAEGYAISKVLDVSNTGNYDPEAISVQGAINRVMRTIAYSTWYGNKAINSLEFPGFVQELVDASQVLDARGDVPKISALKELTVEVRTAWGLTNEFWMHPHVKSVIDNYYVGAKEFVVPPGGNPTVGYNIPGLIGADIKNERLEFKTDMWLNRHQIGLPKYRDANNVLVEGKTNPKAPDAPAATAIVSGGPIAGSKWKTQDSKNLANVNAQIKYHIIACNRYGRSAKSTVVTSDAAMESGKSITLTITPAGTGEVATYFQIFRENYPGSGKFYLTERIAKASSPTTVHADLNEWIPGCSEAIIGDFNSTSALDQSRTYQFLRMLPMVQTKFAPSAVYQRKLAGMVEFYGALALLQPKRFWLLKNMPTSLGR